MRRSGATAGRKKCWRKCRPAPNFTTPSDTMTTKRLTPLSLRRSFRGQKRRTARFQVTLDPEWARHMDTRTSRYHEVYARAQRDPEGFWGEAAAEIDWFEPAKKVFDPSAGVYGRWFVGASCNTCFNALDRHVRDGRGEQTALIYDSPVTGTKASYSY